MVPGTGIYLAVIYLVFKVARLEARLRKLEIPR